MRVPCRARRRTLRARHRSHKRRNVYAKRGDSCATVIGSSPSGHCRKVLENIAALVTLPTAKSLQGISAQDRTKDERWAVTYYDMFSLTSAAHHETAKISFGQVDAEAILACTAALVLNYTS